MNDPLILALDQGTTSSRTLLIDHNGVVLDAVQVEFRQHFPKSGWVEHDPMDIWQSQSDSLKRLISGHEDKVKRIAVAGITNQRETTILWDRETGEPVHNAIVWQDRRTAAFCRTLIEDGWREPIREKTGLVIDAYFSATKIKWILENVAGIRERAQEGQIMAGTVDSWLIYQLTGKKLHATDVTNASRTMMFNIRTMEWDHELLELFGIPASILPEVRANTAGFGHIVKGIFGHEIPIGAVAGDQQAALFGQRCFEPGMIKNTYGTGCFMVMNTGSEVVTSDSGLLGTVAWQLDEEVSYALEGSIFVGGAIVQWLRDGLKIIDKSSEIEGLAESEEDNGGVYFVPALTGLGAPHWDSSARGTILGISRGTTRGHIARAALEGIAFQVWEVVEKMTEDYGKPPLVLRCDGGAAANNMLMQFQCDLMGIQIERPRIMEATAMGVAYLAGISAGIWSGASDIGKLTTAFDTFTPKADDEKIKRYKHYWRKAVDRSLRWLED